MEKDHEKGVKIISFRLVVDVVEHENTKMKDRVDCQGVSAP